MLSPLYSVFREFYEELRIYGEVFIDAGVKGCYQTADAIGFYPVRSTLKPFQFLATGNPAVKGEDRERQAASLGSPSASLDQIEKLMEWYSGEDWESRMKAPCVWPQNAESRALLRDRGDTNPIFGYCFSKHMAILEACDREHWDPKTYNSQNHPYFGRLKNLIASALGSKRPIDWLVDGCSLPTPVLSLAELSLLYRKLSLDPSWALARELMLDFPEWIGGPGRADTDLMQENEKKLVAKEGADGLLCLGIVPNKNYPDGVGVSIKLSHGLDHKALKVVGGYVLTSLGLESRLPKYRNQTVQYHFKPFQKREEWIDISPLNETAAAVFPGDTPYSREVLMDTKKGSHLTLSSIRTTVHVGAHADAPNHFSKDGRGIDSVSPENYLGVCQVIVVKRRQGSIKLEDIKETPIQCSRILFRTDSFANSKRWTDEFVSIDSAVIDYLGKSGVFLIGIDTPSIDPSVSKALKAHKATLNWDMRILEGLCLKGVSDGFYDLVAAPLRLEGADASPVRALLRMRPYSGRSPSPI